MQWWLLDDENESGAKDAAALQPELKVCCNNAYLQRSAMCCQATTIESVESLGESQSTQSHERPYGVLKNWKRGRMKAVST